MNNHIDQRMRQLMHELSDNAPTPNGWDEITIVRSAAAQRQSWWLVVATAAVAVVGVVAVGVAVIREPSAVLPDVVGTLPESPAPSTSATAAPRTGSSTTSSPTSTSPPTSPPGDVVAPIDVSYQEVPASLDLLAFATIGLPEGSRGPGALAPVAALDAGRAVVVDQETGQLIVVESSGVRRSVPLTVKYPPFLVTGGPGDVIYGIVPAPTTDLALAAIVAIPVTGDLAGTVVASESLSINPYSDIAAVSRQRRSPARCVLARHRAKHVPRSALRSPRRMDVVDRRL